MPKKEVEKHNTLQKILQVIGIISGIVSVLFFGFILLWLVFAFAAPAGFCNVAIKPIKGIITTEPASPFGEEATSSRQVLEWIENVNKDKSIKAVIFEIDSPGG